MIPRLRTGRRPDTVDDFPGVLIPLDEAHLHSHSSRAIGSGSPRQSDDDAFDDDGGVKDVDDEDTGMLEMSAVSEYSIEGLRKEVRRGGRGKQWTAYECEGKLFSSFSTVNTNMRRTPVKSKLINKAIQDIGMGRYNWQLFVLCGFGWFADNLWMQGISLTLPSLSAEFGVSEKSVRYTTSALFVGLCLGSFFWGIGSDILGRRIAFNITLLLTSVFGTASAWASSWPGVCLMYAALGFGVGGNLPVDGALFLEFLPDASSSLLTLLSVWWPVGQLCSSLFAWYFIANWPADQGWRYFVMTIGIITFAMFIVRFFLFHMFESPKYLLSRGRQAEAVAVVHGIAFRNNTKTWLTEEILDAIVDDPAPRHRRRVAATNIIKERLASFSAERILPLFSNRTLGLTTSLLWFCWATIGMGYPLFNAFLPQYLSHGGSHSSAVASEITAETYRNYAITSIVGVPGSLLAAYAVDMRSPFLGRRGTLAISTLVSAIFLFLFVKLGKSPSSQLAFSCVEAFAQNIMYGVLYAFTPEIFPAPVRGAGTGVASFLNRATGLLAPIIAATVPGDGTTAPVYLAAALILAAFVAICLIPIETRGRQRL
ncbi:Synaptic vesicle 2-related protein [Madurella mycetomatis]|uniref:Synaptic vesicle 2-related protein n=1 Tax=Madurella mycetomatis TaxID=100816 RepID=A0A175VTE0_9PEZI|nr:Synaptic vesicle 2-related protein [Madurella mycetomatis]